MVSDPVALPVGDQQDLVLTVHFPTPTGPVTFHGQSRQTNFIGASDLTSAAGGAGFTIRPNCCWFFLSGIDVQRRHSPGSVVVFGDSIADGNGSTVNANKRWPDLLADRLIDARPDVRTPGVLNLSLAGNRLNHEGPEPGAGGFPGYHELGPNALARLDEDVFAQTDARTVITGLGINDIWMSGDSAEQIIASLRQVNQQVKARGLRSLVTTLSPYEGHGNPGGVDAGEGGHPAGGERVAARQRRVRRAARLRPGAARSGAAEPAAARVRLGRPHPPERRRQPGAGERRTAATARL